MENIIKLNLYTRDARSCTKYSYLFHVELSISQPNNPLINQSGA